MTNVWGEGLGIDKSNGQLQKEVDALKGGSVAAFKQSVRIEKAVSCTEDHFMTYIRIFRNYNWRWKILKMH